MTSEVIAVMTWAADDGDITSRPEGTPMSATTSSIRTASPLLLPRALRVNAVVTAATGVAALAGAGALDDRLGIATPILVVLGIGLVGYAALLGRWSTLAPVPPAIGRFAVAADAAWVAVSAAVLVADPGSLTTAGRWTIAVVALGVADLALAQYVGLRRQQAG